MIGRVLRGRRPSEGVDRRVAASFQLQVAAKLWRDLFSDGRAETQAGAVSTMTNERPDQHTKLAHVGHGAHHADACRAAPPERAAPPGKRSVRRCAS